MKLASSRQQQIDILTKKPVNLEKFEVEYGVMAELIAIFIWLF